MNATSFARTRQRRPALGAIWRCWMVVLILTALSGTVAAQEPWIDWHGPLADGILGLRFGMDRNTCLKLVKERDFRPRGGRPGTLRAAGKLAGAPAEIVLEFLPARSRLIRERLYRIRIHWEDPPGGPNQGIRIFRRLDEGLAQRYGEPLAKEDTTQGALSTGQGSFRRRYHGPEMLARLELKARAREEVYLLLLLDSYQLHPELAGR